MTLYWSATLVTYVSGATQKSLEVWKTNKQTKRLDNEEDTVVTFSLYANRQLQKQDIKCVIIFNATCE